MPERQSRHPDNDLIDQITQDATPDQQGSAGGDVNTRVGSRADLNGATDPDNREPTVGSDNPEQDARKGEKTMRAIKSGNQA